MPAVRKGAILVVILALGYLLAVLPARSAPPTPADSGVSISAEPMAVID